MRPRDELPYIEYQPESGGTERIYADAWESEDLDFPALITSNAVESGVRVSDHYQPEPIVVSCRMFFSEEPIRGDLDPEFVGRQRSVKLALPPYPDNTPLLSPRGLTNMASAGVGALAAAVGLGAAPPADTVTVLRFDAAPGRLRRVLETVIQLREKRVLFAIGASVARLESMGLKRAKIARSNADGSGGAIDFTFEQMTFVQTLTAAAVPLPLEPRGQKKKSDSTGKGSDVPEGPKKSALKALLGG